MKTDDKVVKSEKKPKLKKTKLVKGATALIASLGFIAAANQSTNSHSQALVEVKSEYLPQDFDFSQNHELHLSAQDMQHFSLKDAYTTFDVRNSYL